MRFESYAMKEERWRELHPDLERVLFSESDIRARVHEIGSGHHARLCRKSSLRSSRSRAVRRSSWPIWFARSTFRSKWISWQFLRTEKRLKSSGIVRIQKDLLDPDIMGRDVLIAEDVIDTGLTLRYLIKNLQSRKPASLSIAALLRKDYSRTGRSSLSLPGVRLSG